MIGNYSKNWDGENVTLNGFVTDESAVTSKVSVEIFHINLSKLFEVSDISVSSEGTWEAEVPFSEPGKWYVKSSVTDESGQRSELSVTEINIIAPKEETVKIAFLWDEPSDNSSMGYLSVILIHQFPETCSVEYRPKYQSPTLDIVGIKDEFGD